MPSSNLPARGLRMPDDLYLKLKYIAKEETRSYNEQAVHILKQYVKNYEEEHGEIIVNTDDLYE